MTVIESERRLLELLRPRYEAQGYLFIEYPRGDALPAALEGLRPDAIAIGPQKNIAIEIKLRRRRSSEDRLQALSERRRKHPGWELRVIYGDEFDLHDEPSPATPRLEIEKQIDEAEALAGAGHHRAALILVWAALEAIARTAAPGETVGGGGRAPRQVLEILERMGRLTFEEASQLRSALLLRNAVVHGNYQREVSRADVELVIQAARTALGPLMSGHTLRTLPATSESIRRGSVVSFALLLRHPGEGRGPDHIDARGTSGDGRRWDQGRSPLEASPRS